MGGYGSNRWGYGYARRTAVEECGWIDVRRLRRGGLLQEGGTCHMGWSWRAPGGTVTASVIVTATPEQVALAYTVRDRFAPDREPERVAYTVPVVWTSLFKDRVRPWFLCPGRNCGRRVAKLYLPPGGRYFLCRHCHGLSYRSRQTWDKRVSYYRRHPEALQALLDRARSGELGCSEFPTPAVKALVQSVRR